MEHMPELGTGTEESVEWPDKEQFVTVCFHPVLFERKEARGYFV